jgi:hypothetical protein
MAGKQVTNKPIGLTKRFEYFTFETCISTIPMRILPILLLFTIASFWACQKHPVSDVTVASNKLSYGDSVLYLKSTSYTVSPTNAKAGSYTAFPNNLNIDNTTGTITVTLKGTDGQSQTGLRYKIKFTSAANEVDSTYLTISGINYIDRFYDLSKNDSIIYPIYNADVSKELPSGNYSIGSDNKLAINPANGQIDIKETIRRGFFDNQLNASWKQTTIKYSSNDNSSGAGNTMDLILYYYNSINDVPSNVSALMQAHQRMMVGMNGPAIPSTIGPADHNLSSDLSLSKPRPPCLIIIAH